MLTGFKSTNHPQQVKRRGACDITDDRGTPDSTFDPLDREFNFSLDVAANSKNTKCKRYYDREQNGLEQSWSDERVWCNPPYSNLIGWTSKARIETQLNGCEIVVMLLPANRCEQPWWQKFVEPLRDRGRGVETRFLAGRPRFKHPTGWTQPHKGDRPPFGLVVVIYRGRS